MVSGLVPIAPYGQENVSFYIHFLPPSFTFPPLSFTPALPPSPLLPSLYIEIWYPASILCSQTIPSRRGSQNS